MSGQRSFEAGSHAVAERLEFALLLHSRRGWMTVGEAGGVQKGIRAARKATLHAAGSVTELISDRATERQGVQAVASGQGHGDVRGLPRCRWRSQDCDADGDGERAARVDIGRSQHRHTAKTANELVVGWL